MAKKTYILESERFEFWFSSALYDLGRSFNLSELWNNKWNLLQRAVMRIEIIQVKSLAHRGCSVKWWKLLSVVMVKIMVCNPVRNEKQMNVDRRELNHTDLICKL